MAGSRAIRAGGIAAAIFAGLAAPVAGQRAQLAMLDALEPGQWQIQPREASLSRERICLANGRRLIQLRHPHARCQQQVIEDRPDLVTVQYECRGQGYGRTEIRRETNRLLRIESQGIAGGIPFAFSAEARREGDCPR